MYIDLTLSVDMDDPVIRSAKSDPKKPWMSQGHIGTHLDVCPGQEPPPVEFCSRRGMLVDVLGIKTNEIGVEALRGRDIREGDFIIFYTGHLLEFSYGSPEYYKEQPRMSWELVDHLARSNLSLLGLDFPGLRPGDEHGRADMRCAKYGKYIIENLNNVDQLREAVGDNAFQVITGWTGFKGATGLSCRVTAVVD